MPFLSGADMASCQLLKLKLGKDTQATWVMASKTMSGVTIP